MLKMYAEKVGIDALIQMKNVKCKWNKSHKWINLIVDIKKYRENSASLKKCNLLLWQLNQLNKRVHGILILKVLLQLMHRSILPRKDRNLKKQKKQFLSF